MLKADVFFEQTSFPSIESRFILKGQYETFGDNLKSLLLNLYGKSDGTLNFNYCDFNVPDLVSFLEVSHYYYLYKLIPEIEQHLVYGLKQQENDLELWSILSDFFNHYKIKLVKHIEEEDREFFPKLLQIETLKFGFEIFDEHHDTIEDELAEVINIIKIYSDSRSMSLPLSIFYQKLTSFEAELRHHAYIEDLILIPLCKHKLKSPN